MAHATRQWGFGGTNRVYRSLILIWWSDHIGQKYRLRKNFYHDFWGEKCDFFDFLSNVAILRRKVNMGFQGAFRGPKSQFPAKYHIFKHYTTKYRFSKNVIFGDFSWFFGFLLMQYVAGIGRKWPDIRNFVRNVFLRFFRSVFMPIACIHDI